MKYILGIDQSTQGTKAVLFDQNGRLIARADRSHAQKISDQGWISHDPIEIYQNTLLASEDVIDKTGIDPRDIEAVGLSNQRETTILWNDEGIPYEDAIVWQCGRSSEIASRFYEQKDRIREISCLVLSPYYPASKMVWLLEHQNLAETAEIPDDRNPERNAADQDMFREGVHIGTVDSWLIWKLTEGASFKTDATNASRTQLFDLQSGDWSDELCGLFGIDRSWLPEICSCDADFGKTTLGGLLPEPVSIHGVMGDSHAALFGQGCHEKGQVKVTLGTGSSIMMNIGDECSFSTHGLSTSLAWKLGDQTTYVFEGNINYAGAVISWLIQDLGLIDNAAESQSCALEANPNDETILVPAFSGLSAPYWDEKARGMICGMSRTTGRNELVKAGLESIGYQITDILNAMASDSHLALRGIKADGGPTRNGYLMSFLSDIARTSILVSDQEELSAIGAAYMAGIACGLYDSQEVFSHLKHREYRGNLEMDEWKKRMDRWYTAIERIQREKSERELAYA